MQNLTENKKRNIGSIIIIALLVALFATVQINDHYLGGDEAVSYAMANSPEDTWMLSPGRVVAYFRNEIFDESLGGTIHNLVELVKDVLQNGKNAEYFSYPRPNETGWYTGEEAKSWFWVDADEGINIGEVYLNAMGDESNPFLFLFMLHLAGWVFPGLSGTSWATFIVNALALAIMLWVVSRMCKTIKIPMIPSFFILFLVGISRFCLKMCSYGRAYSMECMFQMILFYIHFRYMYSFFGEDADDEKNRKVRKWCLIFLIPTYLLGFLTHYTMLFNACFVGLGVILWHLIYRKKGLVKYLLCGFGAIAIGFLLDPKSIVGLFVTLEHTDAAPSVRVFLSVLQDGAVSYLVIAGGLIILTIATCVFLMIRKGKTEVSISVFMFASVFVEMVTIFYATGQGRFFSTIPFLMFICSVLVYFAWKELRELISKQQEKINSRLKWIGGSAAVLLIVLLAILNCRSVLIEKAVEYEPTKELEVALDKSPTDTLVFLRRPKHDYEYFWQLPRYDKILVLTDGEERGDLLTGDELLNNSEFTLFLVKATDSYDEVIETLENQGIQKELLLDNNEVAIYYCYR